MQIRQALTYDDVLLVPRFSGVETRSAVDLTTALTRTQPLQVPVIASPMDSVCGVEMVQTLIKLGATGCVHRFCSIDDQVQMVRDIGWASLREHANLNPLIAAIGATGDYQERAERLVANGVGILLIDIAHGDHIHTYRALEWLNKQFFRPQVEVIAGTIVTPGAAKRLQDLGVDALRVGIGGGSRCSTRIETGVGVPQLTAVSDVAEVALVPVIADGGIRSAGDIAKAIAAGAHTVMVGNILAGCDEAPGEIVDIVTSTGVTRRCKTYRGSASLEAKQATGGSVRHVEGVSSPVPLKGPVADIIEKIRDGLASACSYLGAHNLIELQKNAEFVQITASGLTESHPHSL